MEKQNVYILKVTTNSSVIGGDNMQENNQEQKTRIEQILRKAGLFGIVKIEDKNEKTTNRNTKRTV